MSALWAQEALGLELPLKWTWTGTGGPGWAPGLSCCDGRNPAGVRGEPGAEQFTTVTRLQIYPCGFLRRPEIPPPHHVNRRGKDARRLNRQETRAAGSRVLRLRSVMIPHEQKFSSLIRQRAWRRHRRCTACFGSSLSFSPLSPVVFDLYPSASGITDTPVLCSDGCIRGTCQCCVRSFAGLNLLESLQ